jgi:hypothetical protein
MQTGWVNVFLLKTLPYKVFVFGAYYLHGEFIGEGEKAKKSVSRRITGSIQAVVPVMPLSRRLREVYGKCMALLRFLSLLAVVARFRCFIISFLSKYANAKTQTYPGFSMIYPVKFISV